VIKSELGKKSDQTDKGKVRGSKSLDKRAGYLAFRSYYFLIVAVVIAGLLAFGSYIAVNNNSIGKAPSNSGQVGSNTPLTLPLTVNGSDSQSSAVGSSLSSSAINLQNNVTGKQNGPKASSLQSTGSALNTGQTINTSLPY
jgi:hypothetical protein